MLVVQHGPRQGDAVVDAALAEVDAAEPRLLEEWRVVATAFAQRVTGRSATYRRPAS